MVYCIEETNYTNERKSSLHMKYKFDKKYLHWGLTAFFAICGGILFYYFVFHSSNVSTNFRGFIRISMPVIDGFILAYIQCPVLNFIEAHIMVPIFSRAKIPLSQKTRKRLRAASVFATLIFTFTILYTFASLVVPQIINSIENLALRFPSYIANFTKWLENLLANNPTIETYVIQYVNEYSKELESWIRGDFLPQVNTLLISVSSRIVSVFVFLWNMLIGLIISVYMLSSKELFAAQFKKVAYALFEETAANGIIDEFRFVHQTFGGFITGKILDSLIIGVICFAVTNVIGTPYPVLISVIVGVTNVIPFFGPYLGAIPSAFIILLIDPKQCLYFLIFILILQQFDGNILGPKILGNSTGLSSFWVIFAITIFGGLFGILGMFIGVPVFAVIYAGIKRNVRRLLRKKELPDDTQNYMKLRHIHDKVLQIQEDPSHSSKKKQETVPVVKIRRADKDNTILELPQPEAASEDDTE